MQHRRARQPRSEGRPHRAWRRSRPAHHRATSTTCCAPGAGAATHPEHQHRRATARRCRASASATPTRAAPATWSRPSGPPPSPATRARTRDPDRRGLRPRPGRRAHLPHDARLVRQLHRGPHPADLDPPAPRRRRRGHAARPAGLERPGHPRRVGRAHRPLHHRRWSPPPPAPTPRTCAATSTCSAARSTDLCGLPEAGACAEKRPEIRTVKPVPVGEVPAMLSVVDLPAGRRTSASRGSAPRRARPGRTSPPPAATRRRSAARAGPNSTDPRLPDPRRPPAGVVRADPDRRRAPAGAGAARSSRDVRNKMRVLPRALPRHRGRPRCSTARKGAVDLSVLARHRRDHRQPPRCAT